MADKGKRYTKDDCAGPELPAGVARVYCTDDRQSFLVAEGAVGGPCPCGDGLLARWRKEAA